MDFLKNQAENYLNKDKQQPVEGGAPPAAAGGGGVNFKDGIDFNDVKGLASSFGGGGQGGAAAGGAGGGFNMSDGLDFGDLKALAGKYQAMQNDPNEDTDNPDNAAAKLGSEGMSGSAVQKLLGVFKQQTGQEYTGDEQQNNVLSSLAAKVTGVNLPPSILGKLVKSQLGF